MNIVLLAPPGAGKGTQAHILQESHQFAVISTGEILRKEVKLGTEIGLQVKETLEAGGFPSDEIVLYVFENSLKQLKNKNIIFDGIPRTLNQAQRIDAILDSLEMSLDLVIQILVNEEELVHRLSNRFVCNSCYASYTDAIQPHIKGVCDKCQSSDLVRRSDDEPEAIKTRFKIYNEQTKPLVQYYSERGLLKAVDGMKTVEEVSAQIESLLGDGQLLTSNSGCLYSA